LFLSKYILGRHLVSETAGLEAVVSKFNKTLLGKRLIVVNEASQDKKSFINGFNTMKNFITEESISISIKGKNENRLDVKNLLNFAILTNNLYSLHLEQSDR